ncbi:hypothetical protein OROMI_024465 [Orobanche minor]
MARILLFKIRPSQEILRIRDEILKICDGTPLEAEGILTYRKRPRNCSFVARILVFKIRPSKEILKIRDGTPLEWPSQEILKICDGTPLEAEGILTYRKSPRNCSFVARILVFKIRPSKEILKIRDVARILVFKIRPSQKILKIRDGTPLEAEGILTFRKSPRNCSVWHFSSKLDVPSNVVQKKRVARILVFKIRPSKEILKICDGTPLEAEGILTYRKKDSKLIMARILLFKIRPSQGILKIRDGTPLEKRVAQILLFKIRPSQEILRIRDEILKICDGTPLEAEGILTYRKSPRNCSFVARILVFKIRPSKEILKIRDGTPLEAEGIL